ncbi:LPXTG cell wall anchor domain-containing protein [Secundilactobacillus yichangensis]|uniref:LPXTG cell wall anchor domain-containing protein n=1 Tax=Secundilactobacillus yichangensis TaxID=2799580 RepID=UPI001944F13F|nr:LPXTG cell wall anchor domain-containing protein [Secundilactobacillus yichangensis]
MLKGKVSSAPIISEKQHFRMYKTHKVWVFAAITGISFLSMMTVGPLETHADTSNTAVAAVPATPASQQDSTNTSNSNTGTMTHSETNDSANNTAAPNTVNVNDFNQKVSDYAKQKNTYEAAKQAYETAQQQANSEQVAYQQSVNDYNQKKADYQTEQQNYQSEETRYNQAKQQAANQATTAATDNQELTDAENALNTTNTQLTSVKQTYDANLDTYNKAKDEYTQSLAAYTQLNDQIKAAEATYNQQLNDFNSQTAAYKADASAFNQAQADYQTKANALKRQIQSYQDQLAQYQPLVDAYNQAKTKYETTKANYDAGVSQLSTQFNEAGYQDALATYNTQKSSYEAIKATYDAAKADYDQKSAAGEATDPDFDTIEAQYHTAYQDYLTAQQAYNQADTLRQQQTAAAERQNNQFSELQSEYDDAEAKYQIADSKYEAIKPDYNSLHTQVAALNQKANQLDEQHDTQLVEQQAQLNHEAQALENLRTASQISDAQIDQLKSKYNDQIEPEYQLAMGIYANVQHQHDALTTQLNALQDQYAAAKADFDQATANYQAAENKLTNLQNFYNQVKSDYDAAHQSYVEANDQLQHAKDAVSASQKTLKSSQALFKSLQETYNSAKATFDQLAGELPALQADYQTQLAQYQQELAAYQNYQQKLTAYQTAVNNLTSTVTPTQQAAVQKVAQANTDGSQVNADVNALNQLLATPDWNNGTWVGNLNTKMTKLDQDKATLDREQGDLASAISDYDQALTDYANTNHVSEPAALNTPATMADYTATVQAFTDAMNDLQTASTYNQNLANALADAKAKATDLNDKVKDINKQITKAVTDSQNVTNNSALTADINQLTADQTPLDSAYTAFNTAVASVTSIANGAFDTTALTNQQTANTTALSDFIDQANTAKAQITTNSDALAKYQAALTAKQAVDSANASSTNSTTTNLNQLTDLLSNGQTKDNNWINQVNNLIQNLTANPLSASGLDTAVTNYQNALNALSAATQTANQSAISAVTGENNPARTLAGYDQAVRQFNTELTNDLTALKTNLGNYQAGTTLNQAADALQTAHDDFMTAYNKVKTDATGANQSSLATDTTAMDTAFNTYKTDANNYNSQVTAYNATNPAQQLTPVALDATTGTPSYNNVKLGLTAMAAETTANQAATKVKGDTDAVNSAMTALNTEVNAYNTLIGGTPTADALTAETAKVKTDQQNLKNTISSLLTDNTAYTTAMTAYQTASDAYDPAKPEVAAGIKTPTDATKAWGAYQKAVTDLKNNYSAYTGDGDTASITQLAKNNATMAKNLANVNGASSLTGVQQALQKKIDQINTAATELNQDATDWAALIKKAKTDGRWSLFLNDYNDDNNQKQPGLVTEYNKLITAAYKYIDAINGTTTKITPKDEFNNYDNKNVIYKLNTVDGVTPNSADESYQKVYDDYQTALTAYNQNASDSQKITATGLIAPDQMTNFQTDLEKNDGLIKQVATAFQQISDMAPDPVYNQEIRNRLDPKSTSYTGTTDGVTPPNNYNYFPTSMSAFLDPVPETDPTKMWQTTVATGTNDYLTSESPSTPNGRGVPTSDAISFSAHTDYAPTATDAAGNSYTPWKNPHTVADKILSPDLGFYDNRPDHQSDPAVANGLPEVFKWDGKDYYLAGLAFMTRENDKGILQPDDIYQVDGTSIKNFMYSEQWNLPPDKDDNVRFVFFYFPEIDFSKYFVDLPKAETPSLKTNNVTTTMDKIVGGNKVTEPINPLTTTLKDYDGPVGQKVTSQFESRFKAPKVPELSVTTPNQPNQTKPDLKGASLTPVTVPNVSYKKTNHLTGVGQLSLNTPVQPTKPTEVKNPTPPTKPSVPSVPSILPGGPKDINLAVTGITDVTAPAKPNIQTPNKPVEPTRPNISIQTPTPPVGPEKPANQPEKPGKIQPLNGDVPPLALNSVTPPDPMDKPDQPVTPWTPLKGVVPPTEPNRPTTPTTPPATPPTVPPTTTTPPTPIVPGTPERSQVPPEPQTPRNPEEPGNPIEPGTPEEGRVVEEDAKASVTPAQLQKANAAKTASVKLQAAQKAQQNAATKHLPQTGEKPENGLAALGLALLSSLGLFGFGKKKRQN